jgi:hypothetical protein
MAEDLSKYYSNIQAEINKRKAANPKDASVAELEKLRQTKLAVMKEAQGAGADPNNIDIGYVMARNQGVPQQYIDSALSGKVTPQPSGVRTAQSTIPAAPQTYSAPVAQSVQQYTAPTAQATPAQPSFDIAAEMKKLQDAQSASAIAGIDKQYQGYMSNLGAEKAQIKPMAYEDRNKANVTMNNAQRGWSDFLAARGLQSSGVGAQGAINTQNAYQGEVGAINRDATNKEADVLRRETLAGNERLSDIEAAKQGIAAQGIQNQIAQYNADRSFNRGALESDRNYGLQQNQFNQNTLESNRNYGLQQNQLAFNQQQQGLDNLYRQQAFDYNKSRDTVADSQWQKSMNLNLRQQSFSETQQKVQNALAQNRISQEDASQALQWAKFNADQDPNSFDNKLKTQQFDMNNQAKANTALNTVIDNYNKVYVSQSPDPSDPYGGSKITTINKKGILDSLRAATESKSMTDAQADQIASYYGLVLPKK